MKSKYIKQGIIFTIDMMFLPLIITLLSNSWEPIANFNDGLQRFITYIAIYEFLAFLINKNQLDARKDSLLIYITILKETLLFIENPGFTILKDSILNKINKLNDKSYYFIHEDVLKAVNLIKLGISNNNLTNKKAFLEAELITAEHNYESEGLSWNNTLLLKFLKK
jgi:hypothetical protein